MIQAKFHMQVRIKRVSALLPVLIAILMLMAVWGTTAVYAAAPVITPNQTFAVNENSATGTAVGTVVTTGDPVTAFSIEAGNNGNAFRIDAGGNIEVQTGTAIDFETTPVFTLTIRATNNDGPDEEDVVINVNDMNDAPDVAPSHHFTFVENNDIGDLVGTILATDPDENTLSYSIVQWISAAGPFALNHDNGQITATAQLDYETDQTAYVFIARVSDGGRSSNTVVTINLLDGNDAPLAVDDVDAAYTIAENNTLNITTPTVLDNDIDNDGDGLTAVNATDPANGSVTLNTDGTFTYVPNPGYDGVDTFTYQAQDDGLGTLLSNFATVYITVTGNNDAPTALDNSYSTLEEAPLTVTAPGILENDDDPENDSLTAVLVTNVQHGTLALSNDGSFVYTPTVDFVGDDTFTYQANDSQLLSNTATVTITVTNENDAPTAVPDPNYSTNEDTTLSIAAPGVLGNDTDPENDPLTAYLDTNVSNGTLSLFNDGSFIYTPTLNFNGVDTFTYYVEDDSNVPSAATTVTITVLSQNDPPVAVDDPSYATDEEVTLNIGAPGVLGNDSDLDLDGLTAVNPSTPGNGSLTLNPDGSFTYTPNTDFNGTDTFTYQAQDNGTGNLLSNTATVTITVNPVNDAPMIADQSFAIDENSIATTSVGTVSLSDVDNMVPDDITFGKLPGGLGYSSFDINAGSGEITVIDAVALDIEARQSLTLTVIVSDTEPLTDTAVITINLNNVNEFDPEITAGQIFTIPESSPNNTTVGTVLATDDDFGETPALFDITGGNADGIFAINDSGVLQVANNTNLDFETTDIYTLTIEVTDNGTNPGVNTGSGQIVVRITDANDAPIIDSINTTTNSINETEAVTVTVNFSDLDSGDAHTVSINWGDGTPVTTVNVEAGAGEAEAMHVYADDSPSGTASDDYTIGVVVTDDGTPNLSDTDNSTSITVNNVAPVLSNIAISPTTIDEGANATLTGNISDISAVDTFSLDVDWGDGQSDTYSYAAGTASFSESHTYTDDDQPFTVQITLIDDDTGEDSGSTTIMVNNLPPIVEAGTNQIVNVNDLVDFAGSFTDPGAADTHMIEWDFGDATGTASGTLTPQYAYSAIGVYTATLTVTDDDDGVDADTVVITVVSPSDIVATKTVSGDFSEEGTIFYTIIVTNTGDSSQLDNIGDELVDILPAQLALVDAQVVDGGGVISTTLASNTVIWNGGIAGGHSVEISIEATILTGTKGVTVTNQAVLAYDADGNGSNEATTYTDDPAVAGAYDPTIFEVRNEYNVFLPLILNNFTSAPDLIVTQVHASSDLIEVVIENQGNAAVVNSFWVDFYIDPNPVPTTANELWPELSAEGLAWGITDRIEAGALMTLTYSTAPGAPNLYFVAEESLYNGLLPAGTPVYVQVDSAHAGIGNGAVTELDELGDDPYNNILAGTAVPVSDTTP